MTSKTYTIRSMRDLMSIPIDSLDAFIRDLQYAIEFAHFAAGDNVDPADMLEEMVWTDDGLHNVTIDDASGNRVVSLEVTE